MIALNSRIYFIYCQLVFDENAESSQFKSSCFKICLRNLFWLRFHKQKEYIYVHRLFIALLFPSLESKPYLSLFFYERFLIFF
jgi:hypothetical protein